jgi:DNA polymerase-3 subunit delta
LPIAPEADVRKHIAAGKVAPMYLLIGADETAKDALAAEFLELVEVELRAFNVDRFYGGQSSAASVVDAARTLPMMVPRRVVLVSHAERLLNPGRDSEATTRDLELLEEYVKSPVGTSCLVLVAGALDRRRSLTRTLVSKATLVECNGPTDPVAIVRWVKARVAQEGMTIDPRVARLIADRIGSDVSRLRPDVERLLLYASGSGTVTEADVKEVIKPASLVDDWGMTRAIERGSAADALRELAAIIENGAVPYMILGQLAWFARSKVPAARVSAAVDAVFRTDLAIKTSAGDPRMLLEKLVVELCAR